MVGFGEVGTPVMLNEEAEANQKAAESTSRYVIVNMFAQAIQSGDAASAVQQAEAQLGRIYGS